MQRVGQTGAAGPKYKYDAFGNQRGTSETDPNPFRYCGEYFDSETGEVYLRARYYNSSTGRFESEDPIRAENNWYAYCNNNPVTKVDPSGLDSYILVDPNMFSFDVSKQIQQTKYALRARYHTEVHIIYSTGFGKEEFTKWWNDLPNDKIDGVAIISHGWEQGLQLDSKQNTGISTSQMSGMKEKNVDMALIFGCDTGYDGIEDNFASALTEYIGEGGKVVAPDGRRVYFPGDTGWSIVIPKKGKFFEGTSGYRAYYIEDRLVKSESVLTTPYPDTTYQQVSKIIMYSSKYNNKSYTRAGGGGGAIFSRRLISNQGLRGGGGTRLNEIIKKH